MCSSALCGHGRERLAQRPLALGIAALLRVELGEHDVGRHEAGVERAGGQVLRLGRGRLPLLGVEIAEVDPGFGPVGVEPLRRHVLVDRARQPVPIRRRRAGPAASPRAARPLRAGRPAPDRRAGRCASGQLCSTGSKRSVRSAASLTSGSASARPCCAAPTASRLGCRGEASSAVARTIAGAAGAVASCSSSGAGLRRVVPDRGKRLGPGLKALALRPVPALDRGRRPGRVLVGVAVVAALETPKRTDRSGRGTRKP